MRKLIGDIIYNRDIYCGFVGYTDESWVWIIKARNEKGISYYSRIRKIIPKKKLKLIGKIRLGGNLSHSGSLVNITINKFNLYPKLTKEDITKMSMEEPYFRNANCFRPYTLEI